MMILIVVDFNLHGLFHIRIGWNTHLQWMHYIVYLALQPGPSKYVFLATPLLEMEMIQSFLKDADIKVEKDGMSNVAKTWVKQAREEAYHIEDIIDKYILLFAKQSLKRRQ